MIPFMEKTWLMWWMLAVIVIVRWFHLLQATADVEGSDVPCPAPQGEHSSSAEFSAPNARGMFV
jgi:hypothetical protein